jgi:hypothetical protein
VHDRSAKECAEKVWNFRLPEWQKIDSDTSTFTVVEVLRRGRFVLHNK